MPYKLLETGGAGVGGGLVGTVLAMMGFKARIDRTERDLKEKVNTSLCDDRYATLTKQLDKHDEKLDAILNGISSIGK